MLPSPAGPPASTDATGDRLQSIESSILDIRRSGLCHRTAEDETLDGRHVTLGGAKVVHFGSCSYLSLEMDKRVRQAACDAVARYGVIFSSSRAYVSAPLYPEYEALISRMVGGLPVALAASTSLGHLAALPVLIAEGDAVLFDAMVHSSVQAVLPTLRGLGVHCERVTHNRLDRVEQRARALSRTHPRIFYLCDGVYSMHGDLAPMDRLFELLDDVPALHAYVDDAHGVGWAGRHGAGTVLGRRDLHERMVVALGLAKGFGCGGAALVFPRREQADRVFTCGSTMIFSGPLQVAQLGAGIAAARIHLTHEITLLQRRLHARLLAFDELAAAVGLPIRVKSESPIRFVEVGREEDAIRVGRELLAAGFFVNVAAYPAVPRRRAGVRLMLTCRHELQDVERLVTALARSLGGGDSADAARLTATGSAYAATCARTGPIR